MKCMHQIYFCGKLNYRVCVCEFGHGLGGGGEEAGYCYSLTVSPQEDIINA